MDTWHWASFLQVHWRTIALTTIVVILLTMGVTLAMSPVYQSTASLWIQPMTPDNPSGFPTSVQLSATNVGELIKSPNVMRRATRILGGSPAELGAALDFRVVENSSLVEIVAEADSPRTAANVANAIGKAYIEENSASLQGSSAEIQAAIEKKLSLMRDQTAALQKQLAAARTSPGGAGKVSVLQDQITTLQTGYEQVLQSWQNLPVNQVMFATQVQLINPATPQDSPIRPRPALNLLLGLIGGLFAGLALARVMETARPAEPAENTQTRLPLDSRTD